MNLLRIELSSRGKQIKSHGFSTRQIAFFFISFFVFFFPRLKQVLSFPFFLNSENSLDVCTLKT